MLFTIRETGEQKELKAIDANGIEWTADMIEGDSDIKYDDENETDTISAESFDWWESVIEHSNADLQERAELEEEYGREKVSKICDDELWFASDYDEQHDAYIAAFERIEEELNK